MVNIAAQKSVPNYRQSKYYSITISSSLYMYVGRYVLSRPLKYFFPEVSHTQKFQTTIASTTTLLCEFGHIL